jgi:hypothetical protein
MRLRMPPGRCMRGEGWCHTRALCQSDPLCRDLDGNQSVRKSAGVRQDRSHKGLQVGQVDFQKKKTSKGRKSRSFQNGTGWMDETALKCPVNGKHVHAVARLICGGAAAMPGNASHRLRNCSCSARQGSLNPINGWSPITCSQLRFGGATSPPPCMASEPAQTIPLLELPDHLAGQGLLHFRLAQRGEN